jgi:hypothetical protein
VSRRAETAQSGVLLAAIAVLLSASCGSGSGPSSHESTDASTDAAGDGCVPRTCAQQGLTCGSASDGCGHSLGCGSCVGSDTCGGGGSPGVCGSGNGSHSVVLTWKPSPTAGVTYDAYRSVDCTDKYVKQASGIADTTWTDDAVTGKRTYCYVVTAVDSAGESKDSNSASATVP